MAQFTLMINTDNDAFSDPDGLDAYDTGGGTRSREIARILRKAADRVEAGEGPIIRLKDINGARVGFASTLPVLDTVLTPQADV